MRDLIHFASCIQGTEYTGWDVSTLNMVLEYIFPYGSVR